MYRVFITYRRSESEADAGRLYDRLVLEYGAENVFRDVDNVPHGKDFRAAIRRAMYETDVLLVVVGRAWQDEPSWLLEPESFVREEIQTAMVAGVAVLPVLVGGATMPSRDILPAEIAAFAYLNAATLDHGRWQQDVDRLLESISSLAQVAHTTGTLAEERGFVVQIQQGLNELGFPVGLDGVFGPDTAAQVKALQVKWGLVVDGVVGPATWQALGLPVAKPERLYPTVSVNGLRWIQLRDRGPVVRAIQEALNVAGHPVAVDGRFGKETMVQVSAFQVTRNLGADGIVGPDTWRALMTT